MRLLRERLNKTQYRCRNIPISTTLFHKSAVQRCELVWLPRQSHQIQLETDQTGHFWRQNTLGLGSAFAKDVLHEREKG